MCLAIPGKVVSVMQGDPAFRMGYVDFHGVLKTVNMAFAPEAEAGDFVMVHAGMAIARVREEEAARSYECLVEISALEEEVRDTGRGAPWGRGEPPSSA